MPSRSLSKDASTNRCQAGSTVYRTLPYELAEHELQVLQQAARTIDQIDELSAIVKVDGSMQDSPQGRRVHPAVQELRQQRIVLARLLAALNIPAEEDGSRPVRAPRGVYGIRGTA